MVLSRDADVVDERSPVDTQPVPGRLAGLRRRIRDERSGEDGKDGSSCRCVPADPVTPPTAATTSVTGVDRHSGITHPAPLPTSTAAGSGRQHLRRT
jgi:hypothetical protein